MPRDEMEIEIETQEERNLVTKRSLKKAIQNAGLKPSDIYDEQTLIADPEVQKRAEDARKRAQKEIDESADHIPDSPGSEGIDEDGGSDSEDADHIPD